MVRREHEIHGGRIVLDDEGAGEAVLLLHAGIADRRMWEPQARGLSDRWRTVRHDRRGFGESPPATGPFSHVEDVVGLLDALAIDRAHVVGCSMGGALALELALGHPGRVVSLALISTAIGGVGPSANLRAAFRAIEEAGERGGLDAINEGELRLWVDGPRRAPHETPAAVRALARDMNAIALGAEAAGDFARPLDPGAAGRLGEIAVPTLIVSGALDEPDTVARCARAAAEIPGARAVVLEGAAHLVGLELPDEVNRLLAAHLG